MQDKSTIISLSITFVLFLFIAILIYIIYCYAYYDKNLKEVYLSNYNDSKYDYIYENMNIPERLDMDDYNNVISLMYNRNYLEEIYNDYYEGSIVYNDLDVFLNEYYYGNGITLDDIKFIEEGKTTLFKRKKLLYDVINVKNKNGGSSVLGVVNHISFDIENNSKLLVDSNEVNCANNTCVIDFMFGGLHTIDYTSNGFEYFGIVNVKGNNKNIDITNLDSLILIRK